MDSFLAGPRDLITAGNLAITLTVLSGSLPQSPLSTPIPRSILQSGIFTTRIWWSSTSEYGHAQVLGSGITGEKLPGHGDGLALPSDAVSDAGARVLSRLKRASIYR
jgi:hypothetical protein